MICPGMTCILSSPRFPWPTSPKCPSCFNCFSSCWILERIGHVRCGVLSSGLSSIGLSILHLNNIIQSYSQAFLHLLHSILCHVPTPSNRTDSVLFFSVPGRVWSGTTDRVGILVSVQNMQIFHGLSNPRDHSAMPILKRVQAGIRYARMLHNSPLRIKLPITVGILSRVNQHLLMSSDTDRLVLWAISAMAFFDFFRLGELLSESATSFSIVFHLSWHDVAVDSIENPSLVQIHLKRSKCDQFGSGADIVVGRTGESLCSTQPHEGSNLAPSLCSHPETR